MTKVNPKDITAEMRRCMQERYQVGQAVIKAKLKKEKLETRRLALKVQRHCANNLRFGRMSIYQERPIDSFVLEYLTKKCDLILILYRRNEKGWKYCFRPTEHS